MQFHNWMGLSQLRCIATKKKVFPSCLKCFSILSHELALAHNMLDDISDPSESFQRKIMHKLG